MTRVDDWILSLIRIFNVLCSRKHVKKNCTIKDKIVHHLETEITSIHSK